MTNNTTQQKAGTVVINGRTYTHKTRDGSYAREVDLLTGAKDCPRKFAILEDEDGTEKVFSYTEQLKYHTSGQTCDADLFPIPATATRPRELKDVIAELAKGGVPWVWNPSDCAWSVRNNLICESTVQYWNDKKFKFSTNPFVENPTIIGPEIAEEVKP